MNGLSKLSADQVRAELNRPTGEALGLPAAFYGEAAFVMERERIFAKYWTPIGVGGRIPNPGDALAVDVAGLPLLMVRTREGGINVFFNICPHRGMRLAEGACQLKTVIRCPWHSWSYDFNGDVVATPNVGGLNTRAVEGMDTAAMGLRKVRSDQWLDYVFVDISGTLPPLAEHMAPMDALMAGRDHSRLAHAGAWTHSYPGNWKVAVEGGIEDYHLPWSHPQLMVGTVARQPGVHTADRCHSSISAISTYDFDPAEPAMPYLPGFDVQAPSHAGQSFIINLFPVGIMAVEADHLMLGLFTPDGPDRTRIEFDYYFHPDAMGPEHAAARQARIDMWEEVAPQDSALVAGVQAGLAGRDIAGLRTRFSPVWEGAVQHFQKTVLEALV